MRGWMNGASVLALTAMAFASPAMAQDQAAATPDAEAPAPASTDESYPPEFFARFSPRTALDMVSQLPGFTIESVNNGGNRGLGSARENVLINGERVATKSTDAATTLSRITAADVTRIDIVDGATLNIPGLTGRVANVLTKSTGSTITVAWRPRFRERLETNWLNGEVSWTGKVGGNTITVSLNNDQNRSGNWGPEFVRDANGALLFVRDEDARFNVDGPKLSATLNRTASNGNILNLNAAGQSFRYKERVESASVQPLFGAVSELSQFRENEWNFEGGGDYEFALGGGRLKLIGLQRLEHSPTVSRFTVDRANGGLRGSRFDQVADEGESILRGEYSWKSANGNDWQIALEGAYNFLDVEAQLGRLQADGSYRPEVFGGEQTSVNEKRADLILTYGRALASNLTMQANIGAEYSQISQTAPLDLTRQYVRPKGKVAFVWKPGKRFTLNAEFQRRVDQLDFFDFASSVDLANNNGNSGNARLVPPQVWRTQIEGVRDLGAFGNISLAFAYARFSDIVDQVPLSATTEGQGNLPVAHFWRVSSKATIQFDPLGWKGAKLDANLTFRRNRVADPLTGEWRDVSGAEDHNIELKFRHDVPRTPWAWGVDFFNAQYAPVYRLSEYQYEYESRPFVGAYVEHKNLGGFTVRASVENLLDNRDGFNRTVYVDRRDGPVAFTESRLREYGRFLRLSVTTQI